MKTLTVQSDSFTHNGMIPSKYTCDGQDISPQISWSGAPAETKSYALICDDPDAPVGDWVHWVLFNIPAQTTELPEHFIAKSGAVPGLKAGITDFRRTEYGGPCPPGGVHRYFFKVYALDSLLGLKEGATKRELLQGMEGHILSKGELVGKYTRKR
ncbi:MAG: YbhB/YbcL family Raf kinase inhibitor-like protein [Spirochaetes bacterium]|nr:YbhB/YbcL family Raf kinase inhibitor-like protein [Spirochaetota bacterium]